MIEDYNCKMGGVDKDILDMVTCYRYSTVQ